VAALVYNTDDILADPQVEARGNIVGVEGDNTRVVGPVPKLDETPGKLRWLGRPKIGQDSKEVLQDLGFDPAEIEKLTSEGVVALPENSNTKETS